MIEFFFDCSSPWTYLAFHNIKPLAKELGVEISWRPILVGGIFNTVNPSVYAQRETPVQLMARGGFGSPTIFVDKTDMYFGNDRMPLIREALERLKARAA